MLDVLTVCPSCTLLSYLLHVLESGRGLSHNREPFPGEAVRDGRGVSVLQLDGWSGCCAELAGRDEVPLGTAASK